jgi:hypothetical protein
MNPISSRTILVSRLAWLLCGALLGAPAAGCSQPGGEPGAGPRGDKGDKGDPGPAGPGGAKGDKGDPGPQGPAGAAGPTGAAGPAGAMGPAGPAGSIGPIGPAGPAGAKGEKGDPGAAGPAGGKGEKGDRGDKGDPGPQGPTGPAGTGALGEETSSFAGFTTATTTGAVTNGRIGMHAMCAAAFPGSHLCHDLEYTLSTSATTPPADGAWIDSSHAGGVAAVRNATGSGTSCDSWTQTASGYYGVYVTANGGTSSTDCSRVKSLACCR